MLLGKKLRFLRSQDKRKLKDVAGGVGISVSFLSDIERGRSYPSLKTLFGLAHFFGCTVDYIMEGVTLNEDPPLDSQRPGG